MKKETKYHAWYWVAAMVAVMVIQAIFASYTQIAQIPYSEFQDDLKAGKIAEVRVSGNYIQGKFKEPDAERPQPSSSPPASIRKSRRSCRNTTSSSPAQIESTFAARPAVLDRADRAVLRHLVCSCTAASPARRGFGGLMSIGRSKAKVYVETDTKATFADVAGVDEAKAELQEIVDFLKDPERYGRLGGRMPKGVLLVGPPGTGKTLLARAVAGEAGVPFFSISARNSSRCSSASAPRACATCSSRRAQKAPCIIFIDELDALGRARGACPVRRRARREGADAEPAAGRARRLRPAHRRGPARRDQPARRSSIPALLRAGRFDRQVLVDRPDKTGRVADPRGAYPQDPAGRRRRSRNRSPR